MSIEDNEPEAVVHQETYFAQIPEWILDNPEITDRAVRLYGILARHSNKYRKAWPGEELLGKRMRCSARQIRTHLSNLEKNGALLKHRRRNKTTIYELAFSEPLGRKSSNRIGSLSDAGSEDFTSLGQEGNLPPNDSHRTIEVNQSQGSAPRPIKQETAIAQKLVKDFYDESNPKPSQPYIAMIKVVEKALKAGRSEAEISLALRNVPVVSTGALDFFFNKRAGKGKSPGPVESSWRNIQELAEERENES